ncbi:MAG: hypothetical protein KBE65_00515 [Phycisphaerae bacterium]|nr:hypothetical protein [Phycisphaerae bacterium]
MRDVKLILHPQKAPTAVGGLLLLPPASKMIDGDAFPLYEKAIQALPDKAGDKQISEWLRMPVDRLPLDQVEKAVVDRTESLKAVNKAVRCRQCNWPQPSPAATVGRWYGYSRLARVVGLWAKLEIANGGYEGAILALQTGFGMTRHLGQAPSLILRQSAPGIGRHMCREVEELVQIEGAPNLSLALAGLSGLLGDIEKVLADDKKDARSDQMRIFAKGYETHVAALECVEAIRSYAASHKGKLPGALTDITEVSVPKDSIADAPFRYALSGSTAVLEFSLPGGVFTKDGSEERVLMVNTRYEISIKN